jgi:hypothetical protein
MANGQELRPPREMQHQRETPSPRSRHTDFAYARRICKLYVSILCTYKPRRSGEGTEYACMKLRYISDNLAD